MHILFTSSWLPKNGLVPGHFLTRDKEPWQVVLAYHLVWECLSLFRLNVHSFVLFNCVYHMGPGHPPALPVSCEQGQNPPAIAQEACVQASGLWWLPGGTLGLACTTEVDVAVFG